MNRREALLALTALPGLTRISKADLKPDDVIVIETDHPISTEIAARIVEYTQQVWPNRKVLVLDSGLKLKVVSQ